MRLMHLSFVSPWVDLGDTPRELIFVTNKNDSKPLGKGYKINDKKPFPRGKYEHPQHNILYQEPMSTSMQLHYILVTAFS